MAKAILSNKIYLDTTPELTKELVKALTYKIKKPPRPGLTHFSMYDIVKTYKIIGPKVIAIPSGRLDLIPSDYEIIDRRTTNEMPFPDPKLALRSDQQYVYDNVDGMCFINAMVGWGKTFTALHIARKLGEKTLIVCHTTVLRDQWIEEAKTLFDMPIGVVGSGEFDIDHAIVVGNIQTLSKRLPELAKEFGTVILDECLDYTTRITTLEQGIIQLGTIVNNKLPVHVLSMDTQTGISSYKKVLRYFKNPHTECLKITHSGGGSFKCTKNHGVYVLADKDIIKIPAEYLEEGDLIIQDTISHKSTHILNNEWYPIALGLILGDGALQYPHKGSDSVRIKVTHGQDQFDYLNWKANTLMGDFTEVLGSSGYSSDKKIKSVTTKSFYDLDDWHSQLYVKGHKRIISENLCNLMDRRTWALFFQDDGSASQTADSLTFSICELDETSTTYLMKSLNNLFNITDAVQFVCSRGFRYLRLNKVATMLFLRGINGLVHPQLYYKLNSIKDEIKPFDFPLPNIPLFNEHYCTRKVTKIEDAYLTGNHRFNIEVEDNHTYFASGILVSNCHHVSANTFATFIDGMYAKHKIGLSGTMTRKDGRQVVFKDFFGPKLFQPAQSNTMTPSVKVVHTGISLAPGEAWANKVNTLLYDEEYQGFIAKVALTQMSIGHKVLIVADRVDFLNKMGELIGEKCVCITGETDTDIRKDIKRQVEEGEKDCVAGSRQIISEGWSVNPLSCVILAGPISAPAGADGLLEQIIGRIQRMWPGKLEPLVIDMQFAGYADKKQNKERIAFYTRKGWEITGVQ